MKPIIYISNYMINLSVKESDFRSKPYIKGFIDAIKNYNFEESVNVAEGEQDLFNHNKTLEFGFKGSPSDAYDFGYHKASKEINKECKFFNDIGEDKYLDIRGDELLINA